MPMILLTVPRRARKKQCILVDQELQRTLRAEGVQGGITIWAVKLAIRKNRLLLEYKSRQEVTDPNRLAQVMAEAVARIFKRQEVEVVVIKLDSLTTGIHIRK